MEMPDDSDALGILRQDLEHIAEAMKADETPVNEDYELQEEGETADQTVDDKHTRQQSNEK